MKRDAIFINSIIDRRENSGDGQIDTKCKRHLVLVALVFGVLFIGCSESFTRKNTPSDSATLKGTDSDAGNLKDSSMEMDSGVVSENPNDSNTSITLRDAETVSITIPCASDYDCPNFEPCLPSGYCDLSLTDGAGIEQGIDLPEQVDAAGLLDIFIDKEDSDRGCTVNADCEIVPLNCCYTCDPDLSTFDVFNRAGAERERDRCGDTVCDSECEGLVLPTLAAVCARGKCVKHDLGYNELSYCSIDDDCHIRSAGCCECGASTAPGYLIAVSDESAYQDLVCEADQICEDCTVEYPPEVFALCSQGRCQVADPRP